MVIKYGTLQKALREDPACHPGRMTPEQKAAEDRCILIILNDWRKRNGFSILTAEEAGLVPEVA